jgi:hypothetical protein
MANTRTKPTCFMAMPITTQQDDVDRYNGDSDHWSHVMISLFAKAIEQAGFEPIKPVAQGAHLIHGLIIRHLSTADLVLVDLSTHNPNVFFELGVRTSLNLPIALVRDEHTTIPFDTSGINTYTYDSNLRGWEIEEQQQSLSQHILDSHSSCGGQNPLWRQFGLTIKAQEPDTNESPLEAKVDLLTDRMFQLQARLEDERALRDRDRAMMQEEVHRRLSRGTWADLQQSDPSRSMPVDLYAAAMNRILANRVEYTVEPMSSTSAIVRVDANANSSEIARIRDLAEKYEVAIDVHQVGIRDAPDEPSRAARSGHPPGNSSSKAAARRERDRQLGRSRPDPS